MREREGRTVRRLDVVARLARAQLGDEVAHAEADHEAVEQAVHDLEPGLAAAEDGRHAAHVARLALLARVLHDDVRHLENAQRERVLAVLAHRLEKAGQERRAHDLVLDRLGVGEHDRLLARVDAV